MSQRQTTLAAHRIASQSPARHRTRDRVGLRIRRLALAIGLLLPGLALGQSYWIVLGSFQNPDKAASTAATLRPALTSSVQVVEHQASYGPLARVVMGPYAERSAADSALAGARAVVRDAWVTADQGYVAASTNTTFGGDALTQYDAYAPQYTGASSEQYTNPSAPVYEQPGTAFDSASVPDVDYGLGQSSQTEYGTQYGQGYTLSDYLRDEASQRQTEVNQTPPVDYQLHRLRRDSAGSVPRFDADRVQQQVLPNGAGWRRLMPSMPKLPTIPIPFRSKDEGDQSSIQNDLPASRFSLGAATVVQSGRGVVPTAAMSTDFRPPGAGRVGLARQLRAWWATAAGTVQNAVVMPGRNVTGARRSVPRTRALAESDAETLPQAPGEAATSAEPQLLSAAIMPVSSPNAEVASAGSAALVELSRPVLDMAPIRPQRFVHSEVDIDLDGHLDEAIWASVPATDDMTVLDPDTLEQPRHATEMRLLYTERGLYVGVILYQPPETLIARLSSRDERSVNRDQFSLTLDTSGEGRFGYFFSVYLGDTLGDGTVLPERQFRGNWDGPWRGRSQERDDGWSTEMFIPWSMMAMPAAERDRKMGLYVSRKVAYLDERWGTPALPNTQPKFMSALQPLIFEEVNPRQQLTFYPFVSATYDNVEFQDRYQVGADVFWRPSSNLQVTATANPDFGNVENDDVDVNLSGFETFFPEKRPFFLEGFEIFNAGPRAEGRFGSPLTLVNTRRIGAPPRAPDNPLDADIPDRELAQLTPLLGALKVTGQAGNLRYGALGASEDQTKFDATIVDTDLGGISERSVNVHQTGRDYGVGRLLYESSGASGYRAVGWLGTVVDHPDFTAKVNGIDLHYLSKSGAWKVDGQVMHSSVTDQDDGAGAFVDVEYRPRKGLRHRMSFDYLDENLDINDFGFARRTDSIAVSYRLSNTQNNVWGLRTRESRLFINQQFAESDHRSVRSGLFLREEWTFRNLSKLKFDYDFFPKRWEDRNSGGNGDYRVNQRSAFDVDYSSDPTQPLAYAVSVEYRDEDLDGHRLRYQGKMMFRPIDRFSAELDVRFDDRTGWLVHQQDRDITSFEADTWQPRLNMDFFFSAKQQLRLSLQWIGIQAEERAALTIPEGDGELVERVRTDPDEVDDFTISSLAFQLRYRWEIAPLSDLFVVYTKNGARTGIDDSFGEIFSDAFDNPSNEQLVVKLRYRFGT